MAERVQEPPAPTSSEGERQPDERAPARSPDLQKFQSLIRQLEGKETGDRGLLAIAIIDLLVAMRAPGNDAAEAVAILKQLELQTLGWITDAHGRNARKEAVETLMVMGFPHALLISPEDFEFARRHVRSAPGPRGVVFYVSSQTFRALAAYYGLTLLGLAWQGLVVHADKSPHEMAGQGVAVGFAVTLLGILIAPRQPEGASTAVYFPIAVALLGAVVAAAIVPGAIPGLGLVGLGAAFFVNWFRKASPR